MSSRNCSMPRYSPSVSVKESCRRKPTTYALDPASGEGPRLQLRHACLKEHQILVLVGIEIGDRALGVLAERSPQREELGLSSVAPCASSVSSSTRLASLASIGEAPVSPVSFRSPR